MFIYPVYLLNLVLILIIFRINKLTNDGNRYFLGYLNLHFVFQLLTTLNISFFHIFDYGLPVALVCVGRVLAYIFFLLFISSIIENKKSNLNFLYFIPCLILIIVNQLNSTDIRFVHFINSDITSENILGYNTIDFVGKDDLFIVCCVNAILFTSLIFYNYFRSLIAKEISHKLKKILSDFIIKYYLLITITMLSTLTMVALFLVGFHFPLLIAFTKILSIITLLILVIDPSLLKKLSTINNIKQIDEGLDEVFKKIEFLFSNNDGYLNPNYIISNISVETGFRNEIVRDSIKKNSNMSVPLFINSFRVDHACKLIEEGYLDNFSMEALAEKSGFKSQENFNRVFKILKSCTPSDYYKSLSKV